MLTMGSGTAKYVKTKENIDDMRQGGHILANILTKLRGMIKPGLDVWALEQAFSELCEANKVTPSCKGYDPFDGFPFPTGLCVSINSQCVHCFPKKGVILKEGDLVTIDTAIKYKGFHTDSAFAVGVGKIAKKDQILLDTAKKALDESISLISDDTKVGKVSNKIQKTLEQAGFNVLQDYVGHGIGKEMHEWPYVPGYGNKNDGPKLKSGMTICVEILACTGDPTVVNTTVWETKMKDDGKWVQFEHTILVKDSGYEILTLA